MTDTVLAECEDIVVVMDEDWVVYIMDGPANVRLTLTYPMWERLIEDVIKRRSC